MDTTDMAGNLAYHVLKQDPEREGWTNYEKRERKKSCGKEADQNLGIPSGRSHETDKFEKPNDSHFSSLSPPLWGLMKVSFVGQT